MMYGNGWYGGSDCPLWGFSGFSGWHYLIMLGVIIIVIVFVILARKKNVSNNDQTLNMLKELYVKGDITEEEYLKRKNVIER